MKTNGLIRVTLTVDQALLLAEVATFSRYRIPWDENSDERWSLAGRLARLQIAHLDGASQRLRAAVRRALGQ